MLRAVWGVVTIAAAALLQACGDPDDGPARLDNYLTRLERAIDHPLPASEPPVPPRINDAGLRPLPVTARSLAVLDFLALSGCELQVNIGRRNSSLGRSAPPSQRLLLDLEFLRLAPACSAQLRAQDNIELADSIDSIASERAELLPLRVYNAVLAGPEFALLWQLPAGLGSYPEDTGGDLIDALAWLDASTRRWLAGDYRTDNDTLEWRLSQLRAGDGGALLLASAAQARALDRASAALEARTETRPLCPLGHQSPDATITQTVVARFFARDAQAWLARVHWREQELMTPLRSLEAQLGTVLPPEYQAWKARRDALLDTLESAPRHHVETLNRALARCPESLT